jgi:hypothetical protein
LRYSRSDHSIDLRPARSIEERPKHIFAIAKKILRAPANDDAWATGKLVIDGPLGNRGGSAHQQPSPSQSFFNALFMMPSISDGTSGFTRAGEAG